MLMDEYPKTATLKDGNSVVIRQLQSDDFENLLDFFESLPDEDRIFLRHDVRDPELVRKWTAELDLDHIVPLVALDGDDLIASGSLHIIPHECMRHVGHIRLITGKPYRNTGLGGLIIRELVAIAEERNLEKLQAHVIQDNVGALKMLEAIGFAKEAVLKGMVKDRSWKTRDLAIMVNDVADLSRIMEDWIHQSMQPGHRVPGGGA